jgi:hypothetical protein
MRWSARHRESRDGIQESERETGHMSKERIA